MNPLPNLDFLVISPVQGTKEYKNILSVSCQMKGAGWLEIMPGHLPLIGATVEGDVHVSSQSGKNDLTLPPGILQVGNGVVKLFILDQEFQSGSKSIPSRRFAEDIIPSAKNGTKLEKGG